MRLARRYRVAIALAGGGRRRAHGAGRLSRRSGADAHEGARHRRHRVRGRRGRQGVAARGLAGAGAGAQRLGPQQSAAACPRARRRRSHRPRHRSIARWPAAARCFTSRRTIAWARPIREQLYRTNVEGTRNILLAARRAGVERIVYTSSVATMGIPADGTPGDEQTPVGARGDDRPLQAFEVSRRASWRSRRRSDGTAGGHRQSVDAGRSGRREAHAHRPGGARCRGRPHAGLRRYRAQHRARR